MKFFFLLLICLLLQSSQGFGSSYFYNGPPKCVQNLNDLGPELIRWYHFAGKPNRLPYFKSPETRAHILQELQNQRGEEYSLEKLKEQLFIQVEHEHYLALRIIYVTKNKKSSRETPQLAKLCGDLSPYPLLKTLIENMVRTGSCPTPEEA